MSARCWHGYAGETDRRKFLVMAYEWIKALHIISVIAWMAGLLYLPRLYVYHAIVEPASVRATFKLMERRLLKAIMNPAMIASWGLGAASYI